MHGGVSSGRAAAELFPPHSSPQGGHEHSCHLSAEDRAGGHGCGHPQRHLLQPQRLPRGGEQPQQHPGGLGACWRGWGCVRGRLCEGCLWCGTLTPTSCPQLCLTPDALLQVAGLRGLILRSQLIVLLKHKVGGAAQGLGGLPWSPAGRAPLTSPLALCLGAALGTLVCPAACCASQNTPVTRNKLLLPTSCSSPLPS